ncbi:MAG: hypothetical protein J6K32_11175 [Clostridia bacterium]|nr:hypothetical protein [Clostridia bacterium]
MRISKNTVAAALLAAVMMISSAVACAAETAPFGAAVNAQQQAQTYGKAKPFTRDRGCYGISASRAWLNQARIDGMLIDMRIFTPMGDNVLFQECLSAASTGGERDICLTMRVDQWDEGMVLQLDQRSVDCLTRVGITEIVIADGNMDIRAAYSVEEIRGIRAMFGLGAKEQLSLGSVDAPVTVVSEDGVRRQLTK